MGALAGLLIASWAAATLRLRRVRAVRRTEWDAGDARAHLWTSGARCRDCGATGGLAEPSADGGALFTCLRCGARHVRQHRG